MTWHARTAGCAAMTAAISPVSTRKPRILTCSSSRPMYSIRPSAFQRARSPLRKPTLPARVGCATNRRACRIMGLAAEEQVAECAKCVRIGAGDFVKKRRRDKRAGDAIPIDSVRERCGAQRVVAVEDRESGPVKQSAEDLERRSVERDV